MPELPEVETVVRELKALIIDKRIQSIKPVWAKSFDRRSGSELKGQNIEKIGRQGKYIIIHLTDTYLIVHLRMTGQLLYKPNGTAALDPHVRVVVLFDDQTELHFKDVRKFGRIYHVDDPLTILEKVGVDALSPDVDENWFAEALQKSRMNIKALLLSQRVFSGVGNIYADESLFRSGIHPESIASKIPEKLKISLFRNIVEVLSLAVENMGSTISDYRDSFGNKGKNQDFLKVYQQSGKSCVNCGIPIIKIKVAGRGTHICKNCQIKYS